MPYSVPCDKDEPYPTLFDELGFPVLIRRISCSFSSSNEVLFSFPLRYLFAIGYLLSYLALDGQHHLYSASTFKLTYSRRSPLPGPSTRSRVTPCAPGYHPVCCGLACRGTMPSTTGPKTPKDQGIRSRAFPCSLAATRRISIDFFSSADLYA